ncbi:MAG: response regulator [Candidatus Omnitrophica bacterium]|nr:response regulator [Candidatus Omnitrophota bacterium]
MEPDNINHQIEAIRRRLAELTLGGNSSLEKDALLQESLEEIRTCLEELQVAGEELRQQNEELVQARDQIKFEQQRYQELFEFAPEAYLVTDSNGRILRANQAAAALANVPAEFLLRKSLITFVEVQDRAPFRLQLARFNLHRPAQEWEALFKPRHGEVLSVILTMMPVRCPHDEAIQLLWMIRNITRRKTAENELRKAQFLLEKRVEERTADLVQVNQALQSEISERTKAQEQLRDLNQHLEEQVKDRTAVAEQRADQLRLMAITLAQTEEIERHRLAQILHDHLQQILLASRLKIETLLKRPPRKSSTILRETRDLLSQAVKASQTLTAELSPPILHEAGLLPALNWLARWMHEKHQLHVQVVAYEWPEPVEEVRLLLFSATRELLLNIVKHARVDHARVQVSATDKGQILISVDDKGDGFDPAQLRKGRDSEGGFGLASYRERIEILGGRLQITSSPGHGTRIAIMVPPEPLGGKHPAAPRTVAPPPPLPVERQIPTSPGTPQESKNNKLRVLLADDHQILRQGLANLLHLEPNLEIIAEASDGQMAVEIARSLRPDVIVMDISMPRLNGLDATRAIMAHLPETRVIGLSMHEKADMAEAMRVAGAAAYLTKDSSPEILVAAIQGESIRRPKAR